MANCEVCKKYLMNVRAVGRYRFEMTENEGSGFNDLDLCAMHATDRADQIVRVLSGWGIEAIRMNARRVEGAQRRI